MSWVNDTFLPSGDYEWALWNPGVLCRNCAYDVALDIGVQIPEAVGLAVEYFGSRIEVHPVCATCAEDKTVHMFPNKESVLVCTSDDPDNHQGDTCPIHELEDN